MAGGISRWINSACSGLRALSLSGSSQLCHQSLPVCTVSSTRVLHGSSTFAPGSSCYHTLCHRWSISTKYAIATQGSTAVHATPGSQILLKAAQTSTSLQQVRTRIYQSYKTGKSLTVMPVIERFFRLNNGMWIRGRAGRRRKHWTKAPRRIRRLQQHVFITNTQCRLLDNMVNAEYRRPMYLVNDPYQAYHSKNNLPNYRYKKPPFFPV